METSTEPAGMDVELERKYEFPAGAVTFAVIHREFTERAMLKYEGQPGVAEILAKIRDEGYYDRGVSLYVNETSTGRDFLRFDCFEREPHYHYHHLHELREAGVEISMEYLRISGYAECVTMNGLWHQLPFDSVANGDIRDWALDRLRTRVAPMLREAGAPGLADAIEPAVVASALERATPYIFARVAVSDLTGD